MIETRIETGERPVLHIRIEGNFDFNCHSEFRKAYADRGAASSAIVLDLERTTHLDSSALGMMLLLRQHAGSAQADVRIRNANPQVRKVLDIANFQKLFRIE